MLKSLEFVVIQVYLNIFKSKPCMKFHYNSLVFTVAELVIDNLMTFHVQSL
jgi:hypothetical protein